mmetsp:Transcript_43084/g.126684  ORF Transcript_43084/g.126684 Transcript_43084/m.126684 type:complete len:84 (+) Transcript_43084:24-275(+)
MRYKNNSFNLMVTCTKAEMADFEICRLSRPCSKFNHAQNQRRPRGISRQACPHCLPVALPMRQASLMRLLVQHQGFPKQESPA